MQGTVYDNVGRKQAPAVNRQPPIIKLEKLGVHRPRDTVDRQTQAARRGTVPRATVRAPWILVGRRLAVAVSVLRGKDAGNDGQTGAASSLFANLFMGSVLRAAQTRRQRSRRHHQADDHEHQRCQKEPLELRKLQRKDSIARDCAGRPQGV